MVAEEVGGGVFVLFVIAFVCRYSRRRYSRRGGVVVVAVVVVVVAA